MGKLLTGDTSERSNMMSKNRKGPKQQDQPNLPLSPEQPYGEPLSGSHKVKNKNHSRQNKNASHDM